MHVSGQTAAYILCTLAVSPLSYAAPTMAVERRVPKSVSPDLKKCLHSPQDPICIPLMSDEQVSSIQSSHDRFGLIDHAASHTHTHAHTLLASSTIAIIPTTTPTVPTLVYGSGPSLPSSFPSLSSAVNDPISQGDTLAVRDDGDDEGSKKFGFGGKPIKRQESESTSAAKSTSTYSEQNFNGGSGAPPIKRDFNNFWNNWMTSGGDVGGSNVNDGEVSQNQDNASASDDTGNSMWGFGGGWGGKPIKRVEADSDVVIIQDNTGNSMWGFGGGWGGLPIKRLDIDAHAEAGEVDNTGNSMWGFGGGFWNPIRRMITDLNLQRETS